jgi:hypothetical protein
MLREIGFVDEGVRPERFHQLRLGHHAIRIAREEDQQVERLRGQWNRLARAREPAERGVDPERVEFVERPLCQWRHRVEPLLRLY